MSGFLVARAGGGGGGGHLCAVPAGIPALPAAPLPHYYGRCRARCSQYSGHGARSLAGFGILKGAGGCALTTLVLEGPRAALAAEREVGQQARIRDEGGDADPVPRPPC